MVLLMSNNFIYIIREQLFEKNIFGIFGLYIRGLFERISKNNRNCNEVSSIANCEPVADFVALGKFAFISTTIIKNVK